MTSPPSPETKNHGQSLSVGVLCYGERSTYIDKVVADALTLKPVEITLFCNSCSPGYMAVVETLAVQHQNIRIVKSEENIGSAGGFGALIDDFAVRGKGKHLLLLDDDSGVRRILPNDDILGPVQVVLRKDRKVMRDALQGISHSLLYPPAGSVLAFDAIYYARKLATKLLPSVRKQTAVTLLKEAPYSGLVISKKLVNSIEGPRADFFIYADDTEYTRRLSQLAGGIKIITYLELFEYDQSWNAGAGSNNFIYKLRTRGSNFSTYYSVRNRVYLDKIDAENSGFGASMRFRFNILLLSVVTRLLLKGRALVVFREAVSDALNGRLGKRS